MKKIFLAVLLVLLATQAARADGLRFRNRWNGANVYHGDHYMGRLYVYPGGRWRFRESPEERCRQDQEVMRLYREMRNESQRYYQYGRGYNGW